MAFAVESDQSTTVTPSPAHPENVSWPFALMVGDDTVYADTLTELVGFVIPDYADLPLTAEGDDDAFLARVDAAVSAVALAQATVILAMEEAGDFNPETASEDVLTALLTARGTALVDGAEWDGVWSEAVPLLLVSTDYAPFTALTPITGNVQYFDPSDERTFLASMEDLGWARLYVNADV